MSFEKKHEDEEYAPISVDKATVLQESKKFGKAPINIMECKSLLSKLVYLLSKGETLSRSEATKLFLNVTMLFQSNNLSLRRLVYLVIKELSEHADQLFVAVNTLANDMNNPNEVCHANAIRALTKICDTSTLAPIAKRHFTTSIVDKSPMVSSAALVAGIQLAEQDIDIVSKWVNEAQEALRKPFPMVQYHGLAFLYRLKQHDKYSVSKLILSQIKKNFSYPMAQVLLIRYCKRMLRDNIPEQDRKAVLSYLEGCLHSHESMVCFEASTTLAQLDDVTADTLSRVVSVLQIELQHAGPAHRFAAIQALNGLAQRYPNVVALSNDIITELLSDANKTVATLAITTLLKTGTVSTLDKLLKRIMSTMREIPDEYKIIVVNGMKDICLKYPTKHTTILNFLSNTLKSGSRGLELKTAIVDNMEIILNKIPDSKEDVLLYLCDFIEDCDYPKLMERIFRVLAAECCNVSRPSKFIRYINNRVHLEEPEVRAAAVMALATIGAKVSSLRRSIVVLLKRSLADNSDEVRDRALLYKTVLESNDESIIKDIVMDEFAVPTNMLEKTLQQYKKSPTKPFDLSSVPAGSPEIVDESEEDETEAMAEDSVADSSPEQTSVAYEEVFSSIPELRNLGTPFKSSSSVELTESEMEYVVSCVKHVFKENVVFQFNCNNTVRRHLLENVSVEMDIEAGDLEEGFAVNASSLSFNNTAPVFVVFSKDPDNITAAEFSNVLKYTVKELDEDGEPEDDGFEDEYPLEDVVLDIFDYLRPWYCDFDQQWDNVENNMSRKFTLKKKSIQSVVNTILDILCIPAHSGTENVQNASQHKLLVAGEFLNGTGLLVKASMNEKSGTVLLNLEVRCEDNELLEEVFSSLVQ
eukprot:gb/GECH01008199.1/.p1 GENE.gb/GECH01008199.1/~~gb/GECH01008199.1/.p1  ORF type:complete len:868 (+),score=209.99 gb/GECH01008199.1/:1-2604(+)